MTAHTIQLIFFLATAAITVALTAGIGALINRRITRRCLIHNS